MALSIMAARFLSSPDRPWAARTKSAPRAPVASTSRFMVVAPERVRIVSILSGANRPPNTPPCKGFFSCGSSIVKLALDGPLEPGARERPMSIGAARRYAQGIGNFRNGHADEIPELDDLGRRGIFKGERVQGSVHRQDFRGGSAHLDRVVKLRARPVRAALLARLAPGLVDEDAPHGFRGGAEEMGPATPRRLVGSRQLEPGFMHQGGRLQSLPRRFLGQFGRGELAQLIVNQGQQLFGRTGIALFQRLQNARDVIHGASAPTPTPCSSAVRGDL